uniref:Uncharacterized protein n=1 Tax=Myoviridae sp. ctagO6 TaxID=2826667 RepID=A0A8S5NPL7_9CAUD|nr:MAG TPA: hypothetical protein [Myoviridae sp. ctagO6]DAG39402.1 MAG TPA: hypothetical protein [Caudoviricetes sp.]
MTTVCPCGSLKLLQDRVSTTPLRGNRRQVVGLAIAVYAYYNTLF